MCEPGRTDSAAEVVFALARHELVQHHAVHEAIVAHLPRTLLTHVPVLDLPQEPK